MRRLDAIRVACTGIVLAAAALSGLVVAVVVDVPMHQALTPLDRSMVRGCLWAALAVGLLLCLRHRSGPIGCVQVLSLMFPTAALLGVAGLVAAIGGSVSASVQILRAPLIVAAFAALVVVPTALIYFAVSGLQEDHELGRWLAGFVERRPGMVLVVLVGNLVLVGVLLGFGRLWHHDWPLLRSDAASWIASSLIAGLLVLALTLERHVRLARTDHAAVSRLVALLVAVPLGTLVLAALTSSLVGMSLSRPTIPACLIVLTVAVLLTHRTLSQRRRGLAYLAAMVLGALLSSVSGASEPPAPWAAAPRLTGWAPTLPEVVALLVAVLGVMILTLVTAAILTKRLRLLLYLVSVALWAVVALALGRLAGEVPVLNIDIVLLAVLSTATILWLARRQIRVDGFEVVMTVIVITGLWLLPLALRLMPESLSILVVAGGVVAPGVSSILSAVQSPWSRRTSSPEAARLALACLSYGLLAAFVWTIGGSNASFPNALAEALLDYVLLPLALLLILAASAGRTHVAPGETHSS